MTQTIRVFGVCLLLLGFTIAGCGDDDDGSATNGGATAGAEAEDAPQGESNEGGSGEELEPTSESIQEYVKKANALCRKRKLQVQADVSKVISQISDEEEASKSAIARKVVEEGLAPGMEAEVEELREFGAPSDDVGQVEEFLVAIEATVAKAREDPSAFVNDQAAFVDTQRLAGELGIGQCGRPR